MAAAAGAGATGIVTPRRLDSDTVLRRLAEIDRLLTDLRGVGAVSAEQLEADRLLRHGVEGMLSAVVDLAVGVNSHVSGAAGVPFPTDYQSSFAAAADAGALPKELAATLAPSAGLRNAIVHTYLDIDLRRVAEAIPTALRDYGAYVKAVAAWLRDRVDDET